MMAGVALIPSFACSTALAKPPVGLQLYSLRDIIKNNIKDIIGKVAAIGYQEVETYGYSKATGFWGLDPEAFNNLLKENGLTTPSGHYTMDNFIEGKNPDEFKSYLEAANAIGNTYITMPYLQAPLRQTEADFRHIANKLNEAAILCKNAGLKLAYHNHDFEFTKFGNTTGYDILLNETDAKLIDFELDIYWTIRSGIDPLELFKAHPHRFTMWHIKDMDKKNNKLNAEVGQGQIDFKKIFTGAKTAGVKHYFVEHEINYQPDEFGSIKTSFNYVKNELL